MNVTAGMYLVLSMSLDRIFVDLLDSSDARVDIST